MCSTRREIPHLRAPIYYFLCNWLLQVLSTLCKSDIYGNIVENCSYMSVVGLDEAEAFGDIELMAEFSLLSVIQNLQQGKMGQDLLETLEVERVKLSKFYVNVE